MVIHMTRAKSVQLAIRVEPELVALVDEVAGLLQKANLTGTRPTHAEVVRFALRRGLEDAKRELQEKRKRK